MFTNKYRALLDSERLKRQGYGLEAIKRLKAGRPIVYMLGGIVIEEYPDGRRFEMTVDEHYKPKRVRELEPRPDHS